MFLRILVRFVDVCVFVYSCSHVLLLCMFADDLKSASKLHHVTTSVTGGKKTNKKKPKGVESNGVYYQISCTPSCNTFFSTYFPFHSITHLFFPLEMSQGLRWL